MLNSRNAFMGTLYLLQQICIYTQLCPCAQKHLITSDDVPLQATKHHCYHMTAPCKFKISSTIISENISSNIYSGEVYSVCLTLLIRLTWLIWVTNERASKSHIWVMESFARRDGKNPDSELRTYMYVSFLPTIQSVYSSKLPRNWERAMQQPPTAPLMKVVQSIGPAVHEMHI